MAPSVASAYRPDFSIPPGETLRAVIEARGMTQADLSRRAGLSAKHINQIVQGVAPISPDAAFALERVLGVPARFWNALEANHQSRELQLRDRVVSRDDALWLSRLPTKELQRRGLIERVADQGDLRDQLLRFFGVASRSSWESVWTAPDAVFRRSKVFESDPFATAAWLRIGELRATEHKTAPFDRAGFDAALQTIRALMKSVPETFEPEMKRVAAQAGVVIVIVEEIKGARTNGAARWLSANRALIQLSIRHRWEDVFWFSFFHEAGHVLLHGKRETFIDDGRTRTSEEDEADAFAQKILIPQAYETDLLRTRTVPQARALATRLSVPPGIVIGRLQREGLMSHSVGNEYRRRFQLVDP
ncbi:MAG: helix-turn-helix domain-containing protein [Sciscionella sp.]